MAAPIERSISKLAVRVVAQTGLKESIGAVIFLHGSGRPYSAAGGMCSNVWFNRYKIEFESPEDTSSIKHMNAEISKLIQDQVDVPKERIIIGGFSMGGSMALHVAYNQHTTLAGVFNLSSFLNQESLVYKALQAHKGPLPPLFACHGNADEMVLYDWGKSTVETLQTHNVQTEFHTIPGLNHELHKGVLQQLKAWILKVLPEA